MSATLGLYAMAVFYILAGLNHFIYPNFYKRIIPPALKYLDLINWTSGASEVALGILLITPFQSFAAWGIIILLVLVFPANIYHLQQKGAGMKVPLWVLWMRLPVQLLLIWGRISMCKYWLLSKCFFKPRQSNDVVMP